MQSEDIVTYKGPTTSRISTGDPFIILAFCEGEVELIKTNWYEIKYEPQIVQDKLDSLQSDGQVSVEVLEKHFVLEGRFENKITGRFPEVLD